MAEPAFCSAPVPEAMAVAGLSWPSFIDFARRAVNAIQTGGDAAIDLAEAGFKAWSALAQRDISGVLAAFADGQRSVAKIIAAIKAEFEIE